MIFYVGIGKSSNYAYEKLVLTYSQESDLP